MYIEPTNQKYRTGCEKGQGELVKEGLLEELNLVIDWGLLPPEHQNPLQPGDVFVYQNQVIAVDREDRLILIVSESGPEALDRIYNEHIHAETELLAEHTLDDPNAIIKWEYIPSFPKDLDIIRPEYSIFRTFKDRVITGHQEDPDWVMKVTWERKDLFENPVTFWINRFCIKWNSEDLEEDVLREVFLSCAKEIFKSTERVIVEKKDVEKKEGEA